MRACDSNSSTERRTGGALSFGNVEVAAGDWRAALAVPGETLLAGVALGGAWRVTWFRPSISHAANSNTAAAANGHQRINEPRSKGVAAAATVRRIGAAGLVAALPDSASRFSRRS